MTPLLSPNLEKIAIIGIGCRFPGGANDYAQFFANLSAGKDAIIDTPANRYHASRLYSKDKAKPGRLTGGRGGYIDGFDEFDPTFFGIGPREAECMDPQQRKLLEVTFEALEDAGQKPFSLPTKKVGVFIGAFTLDYKIVQFADLSFTGLSAHTATGTMMTMVSNRLSYCFDLSGPSMSIDTACSSSLVAVHLACDSLRRGESELAIAGGTLLHMTPQYTVAETKGGFLSPTGRSLTFDARADGYVRSEGVGVVVLKRLDEALRDRDPIHAVIIASGVNQDGRSNGITAPNGDAQERLIQQVCKDAGIMPGDLQYIEAHGTSTPVGDPIEANALGHVLAMGRRKDSPCFVGSVKTNIGHTEAAAGVAGLIKTALALKYKLIPPHINLETINPQIDLSQLSFDIPRILTPWPAHDGPARAGVNSFGFGGTNAHVLLEEPPAQSMVYTQGKPGPKILALSARDQVDLQAVANRVNDFVKEHPEIPLDDIAYNFAVKKEQLETSAGIIYRDREDLLRLMASLVAQENDPRIVCAAKLANNERRLAFVFTGMGPQWWAMGRILFENEPIYRQMIERCDDEIRHIADWSLIEELNRSEDTSNMADTWLAQPANFAVQLGLLALWQSYGITPDAIVGHSTGEAAAFYAAGVYSLTDAIKIIIHRSRLQQRLFGSGTMLAASLAENDAKKRIESFGKKISLAAVNSPTSVTFSGDKEALKNLSETLHKQDIFAKFLAVGVPYHSAYMDPIREELLYHLADIKPQTARLPLYLTGRNAKAEGPELDADYWWDNVRQSVQFRRAIDELIADGFTNFLEIGPHPVLASSIEECLASHSKTGRTFPSIRRKENEQDRMMMSLAGLNALGFFVEWSSLLGQRPHVALPPYPWKRDRYWIEPKIVADHRLCRVDHPLLGLRLPMAQPTWQTDLDVENIAYLRDHQIEGNIVFPAAGYIEMASQAMRALTNSPVVVMKDWQFKKALFLTETEIKPVQFCFNTANADFTIASLVDGSDALVHASGSLRSTQSKAFNKTLAFADVKARCVNYYDHDAAYKALNAMGYHYGPAFCAVADVWVAEREALAKIVPHDIVLDDSHCHPTILDACFQTVLCTEIGKATSLRLPLAIAQLSLTTIRTNACYAHVTINQRSDDEIISDITIYDEAGKSLGEIIGFRAGNVENAATKVSLPTIDSWLTEISWQSTSPLNLDDINPSDQTWLIFADTQGLGQKVANTLSIYGVQSFIVDVGDQFFFDAESKRARVRQSNIGDMERLFNSVIEQVDHLAAILYLWPLSAPAINEIDASMLDASNSFGAYPLVVLAQALQKTSLVTSLNIVTRKACATSFGHDVDPLAAIIWGIGRVFWQQELWQYRGKLIDLDDDYLNVPLISQRLIAEVMHVGDDEVALRGEERFFSRLIAAKDLTRPLPLVLRPDGYYLVTGALGALGRLLCMTLARSGARRLILLSRTVLPKRSLWSTLTDNAQMMSHISFIQELEALGVEVVLASVDISDEVALPAWLAAFRREHHLPIRGVFHLAGQVKDTLVADMSLTTFNVAYQPKVMGSYLLHRYLSHEPLDYFVLFSSVASVLTTAGQTNYAAGNAFLDALAIHRRSQGQVALSINWGPWATGMIEELGLIEHYKNSRGMSSLSPRAGMDVLERVIAQDHAQLVVATIIDWPLFLAWYPVAPPLISSIALEHRMLGDDHDVSFIDRYQEANLDDKFSLLQSTFLAVISDVLRLKSIELDPKATLNELGLDSLLAIELRARIQRELKISLPVVTLLSGAPITELCEKLHRQLEEKLSHQIEDKQVVGSEIITNDAQYPLTANQTALWFLKHLDPDGFAYNIGGAVRIRANIVPHLMFEAVRTMQMRHPSLRANFAHRDGRAQQFISPQPKEDIALVDATGLSFDDVYQMIISEYRKPYDLGSDPLMRFRLYRLGDDDFVMMKAVHHIISDAISTFTFIEELLLVYQGLLEQVPAKLPPIKSRYVDFLNWQNRFLASDEANQMLKYWLGQMPSPLPILQLPIDKPRPSVQSHNGASEFFVLDKNLSALVHELAKKQGVTVFMVLLSAYYVLLHRYSGQDQIIIGSPVMGRTEQEFASVYGYFVNPLPFAVDLSDNPTTTQLLSRVQNIVLNGLDNQEYPFVLLVDKLGLKHDPSRSRVFQAMFILLVHRVATEQYGYRLEYIELPEEEGQFDLTLSAYEDESEGRFHCVFKYNSDLFLKSSIQRMAEHFRHILHAMTIAPEICVANLNLLNERQQHELIHQFSGAATQQTPTVTWLDLFAAHAKHSPNEQAICVPTDSARLVMTYAELDDASDKLARALRAHGVKDGEVIATCLPKSLELMVTIIAILKARAVCLTLDPHGPTDRLLHMLTHAQSTLVFVDGNHQFENANLRLMTYDQMMSSPSLADMALPQVNVDDTAYMVFTSGSTGLPKAVMVTHLNWRSVLDGWIDTYALKPHSRHAQCASLGFDVFFGDVVRALATGGSLVLMSRELLFNTEQFYQTLLDESVDSAEMVPAIAKSLSRYCLASNKRIDFFKLLIVGSDAWTVNDMEQLRNLCNNDTRLINSYGLSEATIDSTYFEGDITKFDQNMMVPVGRPFMNSAVYVLDKFHQPVPIMVAGEIWIGGLGVAQGYFRDEALTKERFVIVTVNGVALRLYRTGDLGRFDAHGNLYLLGRIDNQIKIRGHRIEVGEIEMHLRALPGVNEVAITLHVDEQGEKQLCAYVVPQPQVTLDTKGLRKELGTHLPTYMIPTWIMLQDSLPLSDNGKVNHAALPKPKHELLEHYEAPRTLYELRMSHYWQQLLGVDKVGLAHDFFDLGGNSIKLIELLYLLQTEFNITIPVAEMFKTSTLYGMSRVLENIITGKIAGSKPYLEFNAGKNHRLFCFPPAGGHGLVYRSLAEHMPSHNLISFNYLSGDDKITRYADLIEHLQPRGPYVLFGYSLGGNLAFEVGKILNERGHNVQKIIIMDSFRVVEHFDISDEHMKVFEAELGDHFYRHTGSNIVAQEIMQQARDYLRFCSKTLNLGTVNAPISVICDEEKLRSHEYGEKGAWHGCSVNETRVFRGFGKHADMLDVDNVALNAKLTLTILADGEKNVA